MGAAASYWCPGTCHPACACSWRCIAPSIALTTFCKLHLVCCRLKETALTQSNPSGGQLSARRAAFELYHHMLPLDGGQEGPEDVYVEVTQPCWVYDRESKNDHDMLWSSTVPTSHSRLCAGRRLPHWDPMRCSGRWGRQKGNGAGQA